ncbi:VCBS repeat-containing protein [Luteolibacter flavescens]|uniref:VCBS repeat-containing protein n=1 Tax=Luteolibacter flavescens TaxID=1859460 RepID=A0ABT3FM29_9BACT|nr:VCBS repeat-containing protein [Luteolibacter flavescens]MCW1884627.1 VCBS repeat-containing protein [Luteolibacter flavescens]
MPSLFSSPLRLAAFCLALPITPALAQVSFGPSIPLIETIGTGLMFTAGTDMDGDGDIDVLAAERYGVRVLWWENDGTGSFSKAREWIAGEYDWEVVGLADHDLDGRPDVWLQDTDEPQGLQNPVRKFYVARNDGEGSFESPKLVLEDSRNWHWAETIIIDMDGNGRPDILTPNGLFLADGSGAFTSPSIDVPASEWEEPGDMLWDQREGIMPVDIDGDGLKDLLAHSFFTYQQFQFSRNLGPSGFSEFINLIPDDPDDSFTVYHSCFQPKIGANASARIFLIEQNEETGAQTLRVRDISVDLTTTEIASLPLPAVDPHSSIDWIGLTCDARSGRVFVSAYEYSPSSILTMDQSTVIQEVTVEGNSVNLTPIGRYSGMVTPLPPSMHDLNGDLVPDLLLSMPSRPGLSGAPPEQITWHRGDAAGGEDWAPREITRSTIDPRIISVLDLDADGTNEVLFGSSSVHRSGLINQLEILKRKGGGTDFERTIIPLKDGNQIPQHYLQIEVIATVDLAGSYLIPMPLPHGHTVVYSLGRPDFLVQTYQVGATVSYNGTHRFQWLIQADDGSFHLKPLTSESSSGLATVAHVDWDGDGIKDVVYQIPRSYENSGLLWRRGTASGFGDPIQLLNGSVMATVWGVHPNSVIRPSPLIDLDRDGDFDLLFNGNLFGGLSSYWFENDGNGSFSSIRKLSAETLSIIPDLDGDGHADLCSSEEILLTRPGVTFERRAFPLSTFVKPDEPFMDLDGDGDLDFLHARNPGYISAFTVLAWRENQGNARFYPNGGYFDDLPLASGRMESRDRAVTGDLNGDGIADLIVSSGGSPRLEWFPASRIAEPPAFTAWMEASGLTGHSAGPLADRDGDGIPNWDEFAFGSDAAVSDPGHVGRPRIESTGEGLFFTFQRRSDASATGLTYERQRSTDLDEWLPWTGDEASTPATDGYERVRMPVPASEPGREFFRVKVTDPVNP